MASLRSTTKALLAVTAAAAVLKLLLDPSVLPALCASLLAWFAPPYNYIVLNSVILSIAASSRFQARRQLSPDDPAAVLDNCPVVVEEEKEEAAEEEEEEEEEKPPYLISRSTSWETRRPIREASPSPVSEEEERPLASARFSGRRSAKQKTPQGKVLGVARPGRSGSAVVESTWKTITEGSPVPLRKVVGNCDEAAAAGASPGSRGGGRWEAAAAAASPGKDELNRRVEAFINKFSREMRLESLRQDAAGASPLW